MSSISNNNSINNQSNNSSSLSSSSSSSRRSQQPVTLRSFMTRSTIYNRNEARRAKTLALKDDDRPALVRILANMGGTEAAAASLAAHQARSAAQINHNNITNNSESHSFHTPAHVSFDDTMDEDTTTTWTAYQAPSAISQQAHKNASAVATTATIAAAVGAATSEVGRQLLLKRAAPAHAAPGFPQLPLSSLYSSLSPLPQALPQQQPVNRVVVLPFVKEEGGSLALFLAAQQQTTVPSSNTATTMRNHSNTAGPLAPQQQVQQQMQASSRAAVMTSRVVPTVMLFGIKAWLEQSIDQHTTTTTTTPTTHQHHAGGISVASLIGSAGAGAVVATSRLILPVGHGIVATVGRHTVGSEATAAVAYFSSYELFKSWFAGSSSDYRREKSDNNNNNVLAIASAGALAGSLYEMIRSVGSTAASAVQQQQQGVSVLRRSPFAASGNLRGLVLRAAPAHALLFLGYEATLQLLSQSE